jgi:hypothetical protein
MSYSALADDQKLTFLVNLNITNKFRQSFYLPLPITGFRFVSLYSTQGFAVSTTFAGIGYATNFYDIDQGSQTISGLIFANDIIKYTVTSNTIATLDLKLEIPFDPQTDEVFQGILVFSN